MIYRVDLHVHTNATEGSPSTLDELVRAARRRGWTPSPSPIGYCSPVPIELRGVLLSPAAR